MGLSEINREQDLYITDEQAGGTVRNIIGGLPYPRRILREKLTPG